MVEASRDCDVTVEPPPAALEGGAKSGWNRVTAVNHLVVACRQSPESILDEVDGTQPGLDGPAIEASAGHLDGFPIAIELEQRGRRE